MNDTGGKLREVKTSQADIRSECPGCGKPIYCFKATLEVAHEPPECTWFRELVEQHQVEDAIVSMLDDTQPQSAPNN
jgi:hypothetical protein